MRVRPVTRKGTVTGETSPDAGTQKFQTCWPHVRCMATAPAPWNRSARRTSRMAIPLIDGYEVWSVMLESRSSLADVYALSCAASEYSASKQTTRSSKTFVPSDFGSNR